MPPSELQFGSLLAYCPRGTSREHLESQQWMRYLKGDQYLPAFASTAARFIAARMRARLTETPFASWFGSATILVPIPRSAPAREHGLWIPHRVSQAFVVEGLANSVLTCLLRTRAVPKSSWTPAALRPKFGEHFESLSCTAEMQFEQDLLLVDNIVTRGATLLAAAERLRTAIPSARIRAFSVMRTVSEPEDFVSLFAPTLGVIRLAESGECFRSP